MIKYMAVSLILLFFSLDAQAYHQPPHNPYYGRQGDAPPPQSPHYRHSQNSNPYYERQERAYVPPPRTVYNYLKGSVGISSLSDYQDPSGTLSFEDSTLLPINLAFGAVNGNVGFELELGFSQNEMSFFSFDFPDEDGFGDLLSTRIMANALFRTSPHKSNLYIGGGAGYLAVNMDGIEQDLTGGSFAAQFIVGLELRPQANSGFFIEYKHLRSVGLELENDFVRDLDFEFEEGSLNVGFRYYF